MIAIAGYEQHRGVMLRSTDVHCRECKQQVAHAERELRAFMDAMEDRFGPRAAADAGECWVGLFESGGASAAAGSRRWREITVMAASQMATCYGVSMPAAHGLETSQS